MMPNASAFPNASSCASVERYFVRSPVFDIKACSTMMPKKLSCFD